MTAQRREPRTGIEQTLSLAFRPHDPPGTVDLIVDPDPLETDAYLELIDTALAHLQAYRRDIRSAQRQERRRS